MKKFSLFFTTLLVLPFLLMSCSDDDDVINDNPPGQGGQTGSSKYIITASPVASEGVADYIVTADSLRGDGKVSIVGNGVEQDGTYRYYIENNNKFFSLLYGQGNPGAVTTYELNNEGGLNQLSDFQSETVQSFTNVGDEVLMTKISRDAEAPYADWFRLDTENSQFAGQGQINTQDLGAGDELAFFTWMTQVGNQVYAPFMSVKACCNNTFGTEYPDQAWVAVYSYPEMELQNIIQDDRTSFIGRYFNSGLAVDENDDIYAFSSSIAMNNGEYTSSKPSAVTKINSGETEFDQDYLWNLEEASGGYYVTEQFYVKDGKFVLFMAPVSEKGAYKTGHKIAVANVYSQELSWVSGVPDAGSITQISTNNFVSEDQSQLSVGITTEDGSFIYNINPENASADKGIEVEGGKVTAISKLDPAK